jgi:LmbE family N-acetylglucosaminyl deacetylase
MKLTRRELLTDLAVSGIMPAAENSGEPKIRVVVAGGHPGDPEAACGGTMARLADAGHTVIALYATRGEMGIKGKSPEEAAAIRTREAEKACANLKVRASFANQIDADTKITPARYEEFRRLLEAEKPGAVFTHWPLDTHRDHRGCALLVYDAWLAMGKTFALYFFEVSTGAETQHFRPTRYVDITAVEQRKRVACFAHDSQNPSAFYAEHEAMQRFRGLEAGCRFAEAFIHHEQSPSTGLLF